MLVALMATAQPLPPKSAPAVSPSSPSVTLAWDASPDSIVEGYRVYWGGASGSYTNSATVGNVTNATIANLVKGAKYYFAATAYATSGDESLFSNEATYTVPAPPPVMLISVERFKIEWQALAGVSYALQWTTNAAGTNWTTYATFLRTTNATARYLVTNDAPAKAWRLKL